MDITPSARVVLDGSGYKRVTSEVEDPVTATVLALETRDGGRAIDQAIMVTFDLVRVTKEVHEGLQHVAAEKLKDFDSSKLFCGATHSANPQSIDFQQDHTLPKPTDQWRKGDVIVDGPYDLSVPDKQDVYDLVMGLYRGERVRLTGVKGAGDRILVARLKLQRQGGKIANITAEKITTDGSVKIQREQGHLTVFPYPRDKRFRVSLDLQALAPSADPQQLQVQALAAGTQQSLGAADFAWENGRLVLTVGTPGAGRYAVSWKSNTAAN